MNFEKTEAENILKVFFLSKKFEMSKFRNYLITKII